MRTHQRWTALVAMLPALLLALVDVLTRHRKIATFGWRGLLAYCGSVVLSVLIWQGIVRVIAHQKRFFGIALFVLCILGALLIGNQAYAFQRFRAYLDGRAALLGTTMLPSVGQQLATDLPGLLRALVPPCLVLVLVTVMVRRMRSRDTEAPLMTKDFAALAFLLAMFVAPERFAVQGAVPDVLAISALGQLSRAHWGHNETVARLHPGARTPAPVPQRPHPARARSALLILNESVRAASTCTAYDPGCIYSPFSNQAAKERFPLLQMRTLDSTTAISLSVMWSGLLPNATREAAHSAPLVWEHAAAAGFATAYWTSQNMMFGNSGLWLSATRFTKSVHADELEDAPPLETGADDMRLVLRVLEDLPSLPKPFVGVVHLSNTHFPYRIDAADAPFLPQGTDASIAHKTEILNRYHDAIYHQDRAIARLLEGIARDAPDTVVLYTSDHGEQMFEKGSHSHTSTLYEPEVHVPAWVHARPGLLTARETRALEAIAQAPRTSIDILPTMLDAIGLWEQFPAPTEAAPGQSLLRGGSEGVVPMSNCNGLWACAFRNWGAISGRRKLFATQGDNAWMCFDVLSDPEERSPLPPAMCLDLQAKAEAMGRPF